MPLWCLLLSCRHRDHPEIIPEMTTELSAHPLCPCACQYVAMIMLGGGVGSISPANFGEHLLFLLGIILGSVVWAMVVGTICGMVSTADPCTIEFKQNMDSLNYFLLDMNMPQGLRIRAREYLRNRRDLSKRLAYNDLVKTVLSTDLRCEAIMHMSHEIFDRIWYLQDLEKMCLVSLADEMKNWGYAAQEKISSEPLTILRRGVAARTGNIITQGQHWGEDFIITAKALRDLRQAGALTFVEVITLTRADLDAVLKRFPAAAASVRVSALKMALKRVAVVVYQYYRVTKDRQQRALRRPSVMETLTTTIEGKMQDATPLNHLEILKNVIPNHRMRDIDGEGYIVEEAPQADVAEGVEEEASFEGVLARLREEQLVRERGEQKMQHQVQSIQSELSEVKGMLQELLRR